MAPRSSPHQLALDIRAGSRRALAQGITLVESLRPGDRPLALALLGELAAAPSAPRSTGPPSWRVGITGSPGVGKSTFIERLGTRWIEAGHKLAVLAVDPSSSRTHGSILGDKTRMPKLAAEPRAFVRPSPAGTTLGGVARATRGTIALCEAAGYDRILVETVGVGQSETTVRQLCDFMTLLVLPGSGDELQGIKRGIVELADLVVIHKADGERQRSASDTASDYRRALHLQPERTDGWTPRVITASSVREDGLTGFSESLAAFWNGVSWPDLLRYRGEQAASAFSDHWGSELLANLRARPVVRTLLEAELAALRSGQRTVDAAVAKLVARVLRDDLSL